MEKSNTVHGSQLLGILGLLVTSGIPIFGIATAISKERENKQSSQALVNKIVDGLCKSDGLIEIKISEKQLQDIVQFAERNPALAAEMLSRGVRGATIPLER